MSAHKHAALMMQYAQDAQETETPWERWETFEGQWLTVASHPYWNQNCEYRRKPRTININGIEVPEPMREKPEHGTTYFMVLGREEVTEEEWEDSNRENVWLSWGVIHSTREAAELHARALLSFTQKQ